MDSSSIDSSSIDSSRRAMETAAAPIDSLPYADGEVPGMRPTVDALIRAEMATFTPRDYLAHMPMPGSRLQARGLRCCWWWHR